MANSVSLLHPSTKARHVVTGLIGGASLGAVVLFLNPGRLGLAIAHLQLGLLAPIVGMSVLVYLLQGMRWHFLLRDAGARLSLRDTLSVNMAGQAITALLPLGDLTRAAFASTASGVDFGIVAATVTVQELTYTLLLMLATLPAILMLGYGLVTLIPVSLGILGIVVVLTVTPVFCAVHRLIAHVPLLSRLLPAIDELQHETVTLLHRRDVLALSLIDAARVAAAVSAIWLLLQALEPGRIGWWQAAFVLGLSAIAGAISLLPGGVGANEASVAALLVFLGFPLGAAGAAAVLQRTLVTGLSVVLGVAAYEAVKSRLHLGSLFQLVTRPPSTSLPRDAQVQSAAIQ